MSEQNLFEKDNRALEDIFPKDGNYIFLVGAGISMNAPSSLPSAVKIVNNLINLCAPEEEIEDLQKIEDLRYEWLVEAIQEYVDKKLRFLDYFDYKTTPNLLHLFLAQEILQGNYVVTTNFDYMIEYALKAVVPQGDHSDISPIITRDDFSKHPNPQILITEGKYPIYKIHGAKKNIITNEDTSDSLVTTQRALGKHREPGETFSVETFKKPAVYNLLKNRILVVIGYSGSDDFDIGPMLKELPDLKKLIWIDHSSDEAPNIIKVNKVNDPKLWENASKVDKFLAEIRSGVNFDVIKIRANTQHFVEKKLWNLFWQDKPLPTLSEDESLNFEDWIKPHYSNVSIAQRYLFACSVYGESQKHDLFKRCAEKALTIEAIKSNDNHVAYFLSIIGLVYVIKFEYEKAVEYYLQALEKFKLVKDNKETARILISLAAVYESMGREELTLQCVEQAISIAQQESMHIGLANLYQTLGMRYNKERDYDKSLMYLEKSNQEAEKAGIIMIRARNFQGMGTVYINKGEIDKAISKLEQALHIFKEFKSLIPDAYLNLAMIYDLHKNDPAKAIEYTKEILKISDRFKGRTIVSKVPSLYNISRLYLKLGDQEKAFNYSIQGIETYENPIVQQKVRELISDKPQLLQENTLIYMELNKIAAEIFLTRKNDIDSAIACMENVVKAALDHGGDAVVTIPPTKLNIVKLCLQLDDQENALYHAVDTFRILDDPGVEERINRIAASNIQFGMQHKQTMLELYRITIELADAKGEKAIAEVCRSRYAETQKSMDLGMGMGGMGGFQIDEKLAEELLDAFSLPSKKEQRKKKKEYKKKKKKKKKKYNNVRESKEFKEIIGE